MQWDRLFDDLEGQLASEWEAERAALDAESERLRVSRLDLRSRLRALCRAKAPLILELCNGARMPVRPQGLGADWMAAATVEGPRGVWIVPLSAIVSLTLDHGMLLGSLEDSTAESSLRERMTLGFLLRDLARRRVPVDLGLSDGSEVHGTIDRAGLDHLDLALHERGDVRRTGAVRGFRIVSFTAIASVRAATSEGTLP